MALITRYQNTVQGKLILTGNTLMLYKPVPSSFGGPFTTTDTTLQVSGSPFGTTNDWTLNSSTAVLTIPNGATVKYAELTWTSQLISGSYDVSASKNNPITFITPTNSYKIAPQAGDGGSIYTRSADVTAQVMAGGSGVYTVGAVPGLNGFQVSANGIGWFLSVIVNLSTEPFRLFQINMGNIFLNSTNSVTFSLTGFKTPATGPVTGTLFMGTQRGDPGFEHFIIQVGPLESNLTLTLNRPPLPIDNMFMGIISNTKTGDLIDTLGSFGTYNNQISPPKEIGNARFHIDIASFDITNGLQNNQTTFVTKSTSLVPDTAFDYNVYNLQIEVASASLSPVNKVVDKPQAAVGETLSYILNFTNTGEVAADNVIIVDTLPNGLAYVPNSLSIIGAPAPPSGTALTSIPIGTIGVGNRVTVNFLAIVTTIPSPNPLGNSAYISFTYTRPPSIVAIPGYDISNVEYTTINYCELASSKSVNKVYSDVGESLTYNFLISNKGNTTAINVILLDTIPNDTSFVLNSLIQDNQKLSGSPLSPGAQLNAISPNTTSSVIFNVKVNTIPSPNPILNYGTLVFTYTIDSSTLPNRISANLSTITNTVSTKVNNSNLANTIKYVDRPLADCGEILTYKIVIPNTGNVTAQNIIFKDTIPNGTVLLTTSIYVNGIKQNGTNPSLGITIPNIAPGSTATLNFSVQVQCE